MKRWLCFCLAAAVLTGCATESYDTFRARQGAYDVKGISLNPIGLSADQIKTILSTKFPKKDRVSVALFYLVDNRGPYRGYGASSSEAEELKTALVRGLSQAEATDRVVPIPPFILPPTLTFEAVQQIGVRSLSEYSLLIFGDTYTASSWRKLAEGKYMFNSTVDFMLVDNETTAIIAADKLISTIDVKMEIFSETEYEKAKKSLFAEQEKILTEKMNTLFGRSR